MSKKIIIALFAAMTLAFGLTACQPKASDSTDTATAGTDANAADHSQSSTDSGNPAAPASNNAE